MSPGQAGSQHPGLEEGGGAGARPLLRFSRQEDLKSTSGLMENLLVSEVGKSFLKMLWGKLKKSIVLESMWLFLAPAINPCPCCSVAQLPMQSLSSPRCSPPRDSPGRWHSTKATVPWVPLPGVLRVRHCSLSCSGSLFLLPVLQNHF